MEGLKNPFILCVTLILSIQQIQSAETQDCIDKAPDDIYTCEEQSQFGQCQQEWMLDGDFCAYSCGRCNQTQTNKLHDENWKSSLTPIPVKQTEKEESECKDIEPSGSGDSCESIKKWGRCGTVKKRYCQLTCGTCGTQDILKQRDSIQGKAEKQNIVNEASVTKSAIRDNKQDDCVDVQPKLGGNCTTYKKFNKCEDEHLKNNIFCAKTCGRCSTAEIFIPAPVTPTPTPIPTLTPAPTPTPTLASAAEIKLQNLLMQIEGEQSSPQKIDQQEENSQVVETTESVYSDSSIDNIYSGNQIEYQTNIVSQRDQNQSQVASQSFAYSIENYNEYESVNRDYLDLTQKNQQISTENDQEKVFTIPSEESQESSNLKPISVPKEQIENPDEKFENPKIQIENDLPGLLTNNNNTEKNFKPIPVSTQNPKTFQGTKNNNTIPPPNFLIIMTDDQGYDDIGYHHKAGILKTPNMDKFARESVEFSNFYTDSLCAPTRATVMTGRHHLKTGVWGVHGGMDYIDLSEELIPEPLLREGYKTAHFGKWHSGTTAGYTPWDRGFEEAINAHLYIFTNNRVMHNGVSEQTSGWIEEVLADKIIEYLTQRAEDKKPFFINWTPMSIHLGRYTIEETVEQWVAPQKYLDMYLDKVPDDIAKVFASITYFDTVFGKVIDKLDSLGLADDTVVMFFGDNGPHLLDTDHHEPGPVRDIRVASQMYEEKGFIDENGVRNFFFARMNGTFPPGLVVDSNVYIADVFPTVMEFAGATPSGNNSLDGLSFAPLLLGQSWAHDDRSIFYHEVLKNNIDENVLFWLDENRLTSKSQEMLDFYEGGTDGQGLMKWSGVRIGNYKYLKNHTYDINLGNHIEWWGHRVQYTEPNASDYIYNIMYSTMENWWQKILAEPQSFQKPAFLIGYKGETVSDVQAFGAHQKSKGIKIFTHHVSGFKKVKDFIAIKLIVKTAGTYSIKLNYGWTEYKGAVLKIAIGTWEQIEEGNAVHTYARIDTNGRAKTEPIYLEETAEQEKFVEMKITLVEKSAKDSQSVFEWLSLIEFFMQ